MYFCDMLMDLVRICVERARAVGRGWGWQDLKLSYEVEDLTKDDNEKLARAAKTMVDALATMKENGWVDDETAMRMAFRFAGELIDVGDLMSRLGYELPEGSLTSGGTAADVEAGNGA